MERLLMRAQEVAFRWSGQVMEPVDSLAFIGRNPGDDENVFIVTGDSGNGITHGTIAGLLLTDLICGRANPWSEIYDPSRKNVRSIGEFAREAATSQVGYAGWFTGGEVDSVEEIAPVSARLVVNQAALKLRRAHIQPFLAAFARAVS